MRGHGQHVTQTDAANEHFSWRSLQAVTPFLWEYRGRVLLSLAFLILAKLSLVGIPLMLKKIIEQFENTPQMVVAVPLGLIAGYGLLRLFASLFNELRDAVFARVRYHAMRRLSTQVLQHLHGLSLSYHMERQTGAISRDLDRGARSASTILNYMVFSIIPTLVEFLLVGAVLLTLYDVKFTLITFGAISAYFLFTLAITEWRMEFRHKMNELDSEANNLAFDSLINYETVKYFGNEAAEMKQYDNLLGEWEMWGVKTQTSMSLLNFGQGAIIALGVTLIMWYAAAGVAAREMSISDLVLLSALMMQVFMPLGFLGIVYRQIKYTLVDMQRLFDLMHKQPDVRDAAEAGQLSVTAGEIRFEHVDFFYQPQRQILFDLCFDIKAGSKVAVVGHSGAGKSTLARLLYRFYDVSAGRITIDGQDLRDVTQQSLRSAIAIVPQDTVLFNNSIYYNINYGRFDASREEVEQAARMAHIHDFIQQLPDGWETVVGERGLKLSGGEKQRVAIARAILKRPRILIFDEATSSLDSGTEQMIQETLTEVAENHTTLVIAHRLSTIVDADSIVVMHQGRIVEQGTHLQLLQLHGEYHSMWELQQQEEQESGV
ncbi:MAG: ABC transporter ATP-binding protein/permease [Gammaproteobacteria bacterium]|nr:ABC transporter ATP-binding protein/permease [Gammaproteobacteria bacterium]